MVLSLGVRVRSLLRVVAILSLRVLSDFGRRVIQLRGGRGSGLRRAGDFALKFILGLAKLTDGLPHAAGELRELLRTEKKQDDKQDDDEIRPC